METNSAKMQAFWIVQRNVAELRKRLKRHWLVPGRKTLEDALKEEERKLTSMA
jgi:hypothetical protein